MTPFPFALLDSLTRADVTAAARARRFVRAHVRHASLEVSLAELVGAPVTLTVNRWGRREVGHGPEAAIGILLATTGERATSPRVLVEAEGALATAVVAHALRRKAPHVVDPAARASSALAGAFAAVIVAALRRAHVGGAVSVVDAGRASALAQDLASDERDVTTAWLTVVVGHDAFRARVSVLESAMIAPRASPFTRDDLLAMGAARIAVPLVFATALAERADLDALVVGDAFLPGKRPSDAGKKDVVCGAVALVSARGERGLPADLAEDGRLVVRGLLESHCWESVMSSDEGAASAATTVEVLEQAPVVVRVELGSVEMSAREWTALEAGDVVTLGRRLGDPAILRVGGVELARGELVLVEGEYAVRILARTASDGGRT